MSEVDLRGTSALADAIAHLAGHATLTTEIGAAGRVGGGNIPPYPRLRVTQLPGGADGDDVLWLRAAEIQLEAIGDLDGSPGSAKLERILVAGIQALQELPTRAPAVGRPVVTAVRRGASAYPLALPNNQPRWLGSRVLFYHPSNTSA